MMKRILTLIIGVFSSLSAFSSNSFIESTMRALNLQMHKAPASCTVISGEDTVNVKYNKKGEPTLITSKMGERVNSEITVNYLPNGDEKVVVKMDGEVYQEHTKTKNTFTTTRNGSSRKTVDQLNNHGDYIKTQTFRNGQVTYTEECTYTYNAQGKKTKMNTLDKNKKVVYSETYTYHANGNLKSVKGVRDGKTTLTVDHNEYGDVTKAVICDDNGETTKIDEYSYTYDSNGNWTNASLKTTFVKRDGITVGKEIVRTITY